MGITITNSGQGSVVRFRNLGRGGVMTSTVAVPLLLNSYSGATVAYSLRKLNKTYAGSAIRVRRSSDNAETNIGFSNNQLDTTALLAFCGAGNGFVTIWYDQSGNTNDANQTTTANQPRIVSSGVVELEGTKPTLSYYNGTCGLNIASIPFTGATTISFFSVANAKAAEQYEMLFTVGGSASNINIRRAGAMEYYLGPLPTSATNGISVNNIMRLFNIIKNGLSYDYRINTSVDVQGTYSSDAGLNAAQTMVGARYDGYNWQGTISEMIIYKIDQSNNRTAINNDINSNYTIYPTDTDVLAFISRVTTAGGTLTETEQIAVNQLVLSMKSAGIWTLMKAIYPMVGASAAACAQNLKSSNFTGTFTAGWTFANTGVTPNGTSAFMNTGLNVSTNISLNNVHFSVYLRTNSDGTKVDLGVFGGDNSGLNIFTRFGNAQYTRLNEEDTATVSTTDSRGFRLGIRNSSTQKNVFINNTKTTLNTNSNSLINLPIYIGALNDQTLGARFYSDRQNAFASIGDGLTDTQASDLYTAVQAFQTTLSRQI